MDIKRIGLIAGFIILVLGIGFLIYAVFFRAPEPTGQIPDQTEQRPTDGAFPDAGVGTGDRTQIDAGDGILPESDLVDGTIGAGDPNLEVDEPDVPAVRQISSDTLTGIDIRGGGVQFYNDVDGQFYRVGADGDAEELSEEVFFNVQNVTWANGSNQAVLEYPDGSNIVYNFDTDTQVTLPRHWEDFSFSDRGDRLAAKSIGISTDNRWLVTTNPDGSSIKLVEPLGENADKVTIDWSPNNQIVGFSRTGQALGADREEILFVGLNGENFRSMNVEGRGFQSEWSQSGNRLLYSVYSARTNFKPEIWVVDATPSTIGNNRRSLQINTWAEKCNFADDRFIYCGVPKDLQTGAGFAPGLAQGTEDRLVRIDTRTGSQTEIDLGNDAHTIDDIFVDEGTNTLYFTDKNQAGLFNVSL